MSWPLSKYVYKCPHCGKPFKAGGFVPASHLPSVLLGAAKFCVTPPDGCWTDGRDPARLYRESRDHCLSFVKCPTCSHLLWKDEAKRLAEIGYSAVDRGWSEARYYDDPTEQDYLDALETGLAMDSVKTHYLRMRAWWAANDPLRRESFSRTYRRFPPQFQRSQRAVCNMRRLDHSLDERDELSRLVIAELAREPGFLKEVKRLLAFPYELSRLMKAELARELGLFEEAKRLLAFPFDKPYRHAVKVISDLAEQNHTGVGGIRGDEALSQEEIRLIEESKEESKARLRALEVSLRAAEEANRHKRRDGKACPQCGFEYAWDGTECGHCHRRVS